MFSIIFQCKFDILWYMAQALSSALAVLRTALQPRVLRFLNPVDPLYIVPNYYSTRPSGFLRGY